MKGENKRQAGTSQTWRICAIGQLPVVSSFSAKENPLFCGVSISRSKTAVVVRRLRNEQSIGSPLFFSLASLHFANFRKAG
jgi:hypothetical protein